MNVQCQQYLPTKLRKMFLSTCSLGMSALFVAGSAHGNDFSPANHIGGDWGGPRAHLSNGGFNYKVGYFSQTAHNFSGGENNTTANAAQIFLGAYFDLEKLVGWPGADFTVEITNRNGELINNKAELPFLLQSQQIFGRGNVTRLTQFSLNQRLFKDHLRFKVGRIFPSSDFFAQSCAFQHLTFCSGGSSNFISSNWYGDPLSALGGQVTFTPDKRWHFKVGAYDANPQNADTSQGLRLSTSGGESGTLLVSEVEYQAKFANGLDGNYRIGIARSSIDKNNVINSAGLPSGLTSDITEIEDTDNAWFLNFEQQITRNAWGGGLRMFASLINPDDQVSQIGSVAALGGFYVGPFKSRPNDRVGLAVGRNSVSSRITNAQERFNALEGVESIDVQSDEYPIELNYNFVITPAIEVMPSIQYIVNPNGVNDEEDAVILGLQFSLNF